MRVIDGPIAPFGDVDQLHTFLREDAAHGPLYKLFLNVREAVANILDNTTVADIAGLAAPVAPVPAPKTSLGEESAIPRNGQVENTPKRTRVC